jgi:hypothetical protein
MYAPDESRKPSYAPAVRPMKAERRVPLFRFRNDEPGRCTLASILTNYLDQHILAVEELAR